MQCRLSMVLTRALESADKTQHNLIQARKIVLDMATEGARSVSCACATLHDAKISRSPRADYEWAPFKHVFFGWQTFISSASAVMDVVISTGGHNKGTTCQLRSQNTAFWHSLDLEQRPFHLQRVLRCQCGHLPHGNAGAAGGLDERAC